VSLAGGDAVAPQEFGTSNHPFTTSRVNVSGNTTSKYYPYRAAGKLFFNIGASTYVCSASLIKRGVIVTAAHCVANFGASQFYTNWRFVPAYNNGTAPYGTWTARSATVLTSYFNGTDSCAVRGVVCQNDVAVITLNAQGGAYPGTTTGYLGYGWNGYSYNSSGQVLINQLGYPVALDSGALMERTDSQGFTSASNSNNTVMGSLQTGGSSGGPWAVNLGIAPALNGTSFGTGANHNIVVGVTSWGYVSTAVKQQGASRFTTSNITVLVNAACSATPAACT
jgi:V8-like Glu-specific endopeptidase